MQISRYETHADVNGRTVISFQLPSTADWFLEYTRDWKSTSGSFLPVDLSKQQVLDLASGWGQLSRELAARGASVTAVELAPALVQRHPCFPGRPQTDALPSWPPDKGYAVEGWWTTNSQGVRRHVGAHHRMLSTYLNAALRAGFQFTAFAEADRELPRILIAQCQKL